MTISEVRYVVDEIDVEYQLGEPITARVARASSTASSASRTSPSSCCSAPSRFDRIADVRRLPLDGLNIAGPTTFAASAPDT